MKTLAIVVACFVGTAFCSVADLKPYDQLAAEIFKVEDKNGDGVMSLDDIHSWFDSYDTNRDGRMTRHEYTEGVCRETPQLYQLGHYLYDVYDVDHDHHVDRHDWENFLRLMDTGNDGSVTQDEFVKFWVDMFERFENAPLHGQTHAHGHSACH